MNSNVFAQLKVPPCPNQHERRYDSYLGVGSDQFLPKAIREIFLSFPLGFKAQEQKNNHMTYVNNHNLLLQLEGRLLLTDG